MNRKRMMALSIFVVVAMIGIAVFVATKLPASVPLPTHWDIHGRPDNFADKWTALLTPVLVAGVVSLILYALPALEPRQEHLRHSRGLYDAAWASLLLVSVLLQLAIVSVALHWRLHGTSLVLGGVGAMFAIIGNQMGKSRSMHFIGIRTPWTMANEDIWIKTHRLAGKLLVAGGLLLIVASLLPLPVGMITALLVAVVFVGVLIPIAFSYVLWRREGAAG